MSRSNSIQKIRARFYNGYISLTNHIVESLKLNESDVLLYRFSHAKDVYSVGKVIKVTRKKNNQVRYMISIRKSALEKANLNLPQNVTIEIVARKKLGYMLHSQESNKNMIDVVSLLPKNEKFTCFELPNDRVLIYYINNKATSVAILPRFIKLSNFILWNVGFYIAEGLKTNIYRVSTSNNEPDLLKRFVRYLKAFGVDESQLYVDVRIEEKHYSDSIKIYWTTNLDIPPHRIKIRKTHNRPPANPYGNTEITVYNTILGIIHKNFINTIIELSQILPKGKLISLIKGLEEGDGHVMRHNGSLEIGVTCEKMFTGFVKDIYTRAYSEPKIRSHWTCKKVDIVYYTGVETALKFLLDGHFSNHKDRRDKLIELIKAFMIRDEKYIKNLKSGQKTIKDLAKLTNVSIPATRIILRKHLRYGLVDVERIKVWSKKRLRNYNSRAFRLSERGAEMVKYINI